MIENIESPVTLLNIKQKIETLTENDEYLFDEDKSIKEEINEIKNLLNSKPQEYWDNLCDLLNFSNPDFIFFTLNLIEELNLDYSPEIKNLIENTNNSTIILKSIEVMKNIKKIQELSLENVLKKVSDPNIIAIIKNCFNGVNQDE